MCFIIENIFLNVNAHTTNKLAVKLGKQKHSGAYDTMR